MLTRPVETMVGFFADRSMSPRLAGPYAQALEASGVVDYFQSWDQTTSALPLALWRPENTTRFHTMSDPDSYCDPWILSAIAGAATTTLGLAVSTDGLRRGPVEQMMAMLTLAGVTEGRAVLMLGAGEAKQTKPYGYNRSEGLARLEDQLRLCRMLCEAKTPFNFEGNHWKFQDAWIGGVNPRKPKIWGMGGGPKMIEITVKYADGWSTMVPGAFSEPDRYAAEVSRVKRALEEAGRDPEAFDFHIWGQSLVNDDPGEIDRAYESPLAKWLAAAFGRLQTADWEREGVEPAWPPGWNYAIKMLPASVSLVEAEEVVSKVSRTMQERSWIAGSAKSVATAYSDWADAGATCITVCDVMPLFAPVEEDMNYLPRQLEMCRLLKAGAN